MALSPCLSNLLKGFWCVDHLPTSHEIQTESTTRIHMNTVLLFQFYTYMFGRYITKSYSQFSYQWPRSDTRSPFNELEDHGVKVAHLSPLLTTRSTTDTLLTYVLRHPPWILSRTVYHSRRTWPIVLVITHKLFMSKENRREEIKTLILGGGLGERQGVYSETQGRRKGRDGLTV